MEEEEKFKNPMQQIIIQSGIVRYKSSLYLY